MCYGAAERILVHRSSDDSRLRPSSGCDYWIRGTVWPGGALCRIGATADGRAIEGGHRCRGKAFGCFVPDGQHNLTPVQISEGPFLSMAQLSDSFSIGNELIVFVGTWRFGVDSPRYGRMALLSMMAEDAIREQTEHTVRTRYPTLAGEPLITVIPFPAKMETRPYEVLPYPRSPKYFQHRLVGVYSCGRDID